MARDRQVPGSSRTSGSEEQTQSGLFPTTIWQLLDDVREGSADCRNHVLNRLIRMYWKPLYTYARLKGRPEEDAKDLVQAFFVSCLEKDFFAKADRNRKTTDPGKKIRFRTFMRTAFDNFAKNIWRKESSKRRRPPRGVVSLDDLMAGTDEGPGFEPRDEETPEDVYGRIWARELLLRGVKMLQEECRATGREKHWAIFELRIVKPILENAAQPSLKDLASQFNIEPQEAGNYLLSARRICRQILRNEIQTYALSEEDAAAEMDDLRFAFD